MSSYPTLNRRGFLTLSGVALASQLAPTWLTVRSADAQVAFDYYIGPNGSDSNPGTLSQPWSIVALATKQSVFAGKRVGLLDGVYNIYPFVGSQKYVYYEQAWLNLPGGLDAAHPTVVQAVNPRMAILESDYNGSRLDGNGTYPGNGAGALIGAVGAGRSYVTIKDLVIRNHWGKGIIVGYQYADGYNASSPRLSGIRIEGCELYNLNVFGQTPGGNHCAIHVSHTDGTVISNCKIHTIRGTSESEPDHVSASVHWNNRDTWIEYTTMTDCRGGPLAKGPYAGQTPTNQRVNVRYCYIGNTFRSDDSATAGEIVIQNSIFAGANVGLEVVNSFPARSTTTRYSNNTFILDSGRMVESFQVAAAAKGIQFYNNLVVCPAGTTGGVFLTADAWSKLDYNMYSASQLRIALATENSGAVGSPYTTLSSWQARAQTSLAGAESHSLMSNPVFVSGQAGTAAYKLDQSSPGYTGASDGRQIGAWGNGATQIGCSFDATTAAPLPPEVSVS